jgi:hypothetical protein
MENDMKILFRKIGVEKPSEDFTAQVMTKIEAEKPSAYSQAVTKNNYWILIPYFIAVLIVIPFIIPAINWIINIDWSFVSTDISLLREWFGRIADYLTGITITSQTIVTSVVCLVFMIILSIEAFTQSRRVLN